MLWSMVGALKPSCLMAPTGQTERLGQRWFWGQNSGLVTIMMLFCFLIIRDFDPDADERRFAGFFIAALFHFIRQLPETLHGKAVPVATPRTIWAPKPASASSDRAVSRYRRNRSNCHPPQLQPAPEQQDPPP